uniref:(northern house mosquito) hypothetical protein n=1 Tax=Culex pipiens TaxID=7175 RepID=A0A8D8P1Y8_CULPI
MSEDQLDGDLVADQRKLPTFWELTCMVNYVCLKTSSREPTARVDHLGNHALARGHQDEVRFAIELLNCYSFVQAAGHSRRSRLFDVFSWLFVDSAAFGWSWQQTITTAPATAIIPTR